MTRKFVKEYGGHEWKWLKKRYILNYDKKNIKSGDFLGMSRFNGYNSMIYYLSGSRTCHSSMALWEGDKLYIIESVDISVTKKIGIQKNEFDYWL